MQLPHLKARDHIKNVFNSKKVSSRLDVNVLKTVSAIFLLRTVDDAFQDGKCILSNDSHEAMDSDPTLF